MKETIRASFMVAAMVLLASCPAQAQYGNSRQTIRPATPLRPLAGPINLRNIPVYSGAVFKNGCFHDRNAASETYWSLQVPKKVMEWYVDQMEGQGWKIILKQPRMLMAETKDGDRCKVQVQDIAPATGFRSSITLTRSPV